MVTRIVKICGTGVHLPLFFHCRPCQLLWHPTPTIITTNLAYDEWPNFLGSRPLVEALLSRLRHQCHTVHIDGPSLRELRG